MAIAVGVNACRKGYKVRFYTVTELVLKLAEARKNGTLERLRSDLNSLDLLILMRAKASFLLPIWNSLNGAAYLLMTRWPRR